MSSVQKETVSKHEAMVRYFQSGLTDGNEEFRWDFGKVPELAGLLSHQLTTAFLHRTCGRATGHPDLPTPTAEQCLKTFKQLTVEMNNINRRIESIYEDAFKSQAAEAMFRPGFYWIGDLCYVISDQQVWQQVCEKIEKGPFQQTAGLDLAVLRTLSGDGVYEDDYFRRYYVDAGVLGCVAAADVNAPLVSGSYGAGHVVEFIEPFSVAYSDEGDGMGIDFGDQLRINLD